MNIVIWTRVSSREQREGYSIDAQLRACRERAERQGWKVVREFEVAESAKRGAEREAFNDMFAWVRRNARKEGLHAILAHKLDRVCRNMKDAVRLQGLEDECGVKLAFIDNQFGPGASGALSFNVMAAVAQYYSDNLRSEVLKGMEEKVRQGWPMGHASFGYQNVPDRACPVVPHPERSKTVVRIFELFSSGNYTLDALGDQLLAEGHSFRPSYRRFNRTTLAYILHNRAYIGEIVRRGVSHVAKFAPLVSRATFTLCQEVLKGKNRRTGTPELPYQGGIFRCALCGAMMTGERVVRRRMSGREVIYHYYRCANNDPPPDHPVVRWPAEKLDDAVVAELESLRIRDEAQAQLIRNTLKAAFADVAKLDADRRRALAKLRSETKGRLDRLMNVFLDGAIDQGDFAVKQGQLRAELADIDRQLEEQPRYDAKRGELSLTAFDFMQNAADLWKRSKTGVRREILAAISLNRKVSDVSLVLEKRKPFDLAIEGPQFVYGRTDRI
jgi:site-specific DNA recombinase